MSNLFHLLQIQRHKMGNYRWKSVPSLWSLSFEYLLQASQTKLDNLPDCNHPFKTEQPQQSVLQVYGVTVKVIAELKSAPSTKLESVFNQSLNRTTDGWALFSSIIKSIAQNKTMMYEQWIDEQTLLTCRS